MLSVGVQKNYGYGNFNHWCNVSPVHFYAVLDVGNFTKGDLCVLTAYVWSAIAESLRNTVVCSVLLCLIYFAISSGLR
jgi:hypothetical protein